MTKLLSALAFLVFSLGLFVMSLQTKQPNFGQASFETQLVTSTTTRMYSHEFAGVRTATSTQQITVEKETDELGLQLTVENATNTVGSIYLLPEVAYNDNYVWSTLNNLHLVNGAAGAFVTDITLGNGSSTKYVYTPASQGTTSIMTSLKVPPGVRFIRFSLWSSGTSSIALTLFKLIK